MGRMSMQIAQEGISVERAADYQKVLDDQWPFMVVQAERQFTYEKTTWPASSGYWSEELLTHSLGYLPAATVRMRSYGPEAVLRDGANEIVITKNKVYIRGLYISGDPTTPLQIQMGLRVFAVRITEELSRPVGDITVAPATSAQRYGVRVLKENGNQLDDPEKSKYTLHNNVKALSIQQTGVRTANAANSNILTIEHRLGYPPTFFLAKLTAAADWSSAFANPIPEDSISPMNKAPLGLVTADSINLTVRGAQSAYAGDFAFLILKDPVEVAA